MTPGDEALLTRLDEHARARNGVPREEDVAARERAAALAHEVLADVLHPDGVRTSVLGPGWSSDVDAHCAAAPDPEVLRARGWLPLDGLLRRLGHDARGQWAIVEDGEVLAALDLHADPPPDPVSAVLARCRRRGEVRLREVLELRALRRGGRDLPDDEVVALAARIEARLGGSELGSFRADRPPVPPPAPFRPRSLAGTARRLRHRLWRLGHGRRRFVVAVMGVDGSGKSTLVRSLRRSFRRAGLPVAVAWTRPGMRVGWLGAAARMGKRLVGRSSEPGVYRVGAGGRPEELPSRRGALGWVWVLAITLAFVRDARGRSRHGGVVLFDRHVPDALATLDVVYRGVRLGAHRALVRRLLPAADVPLFLDVPAEVAVARKADDLFGEEVVRRLLDAYRPWLGTVPGLVRLDATRPAPEVTAAALRAILREP